MSGFLVLHDERDLEIRRQMTGSLYFYGRCRGIERLGTSVVTLLVRLVAERTVIAPKAIGNAQDIYSRTRQCNAMRMVLFFVVVAVGSTFDADLLAVARSNYKSIAEVGCSF